MCTRLERERPLAVRERWDSAVCWFITITRDACIFPQHLALYLLIVLAPINSAGLRLSVQAGQEASAVCVDNRTDRWTKWCFLSITPMNIALQGHMAHGEFMSCFSLLRVYSKNSKGNPKKSNEFCNDPQGLTFMEIHKCKISTRLTCQLLSWKQRRQTLSSSFWLHFIEQNKCM